jgi:hypothetical protein
MENEMPTLDKSQDVAAIALSDLPDGWSCTTQIAVHLAFLHTDNSGDNSATGYRRSIGVSKTPAELSNKWTVTGLAGYQDPPTIAHDVPFQTAISAAFDEMTSVNQGNPMTPNSPPDTGYQGETRGVADSDSQSSGQATLTDDWV